MIKNMMDMYNKLVEDKYKCPVVSGKCGVKALR